MKVNEKLSVLFLLVKSKMSKDGTVPILVRITFEGSPRAEFSLGIKLNPGDWDQETERVKMKGSTGIPKMSPARRKPEFIPNYYAYTLKVNGRILSASQNKLGCWETCLTKSFHLVQSEKR